VTRGHDDYHITSSPYPQIHVARRGTQNGDTSLFDRREAQGPGEPSGSLRVLVTEFAVKALDVGGRHESPFAAEGDVCVLCLDPMDGPKKSLLELRCRHQYHRVCVYNLLKDGKYRSCPLCQTKIPAELQQRAMTFARKRHHKRTTLYPRDKACDLYLFEYEGFLEEEY
jgi:hypothetical protein